MCNNLIIDEIIKSPHKYALFQAVFLIESLLENRAGVGTFERFGSERTEGVTITNYLSLSFPTAQIMDGEKESGDRIGYRLLSSMEGLYGTLSPLPSLYTHTMIGTDLDRDGERKLVQAFLDIFNSRYFALAYRADAYRHIHRLQRSKKANPFLIGVLAAASTGSSNDLDGCDVDIKLHANLTAIYLLATGVRSSTGLIMWLKAMYPDVDFGIEENSATWRAIPEAECANLGMKNCMIAGVDNEHGLILGDRLLDVETKFCVRVGPVRWSVFVGLLPGKPSQIELAALIESYTPDWLSFNYRLILSDSDCKNLVVCLDGLTSQLGYTTGLFEDVEAPADLEFIFEPDADVNTPHYGLGGGIEYAN